MELGELTVCLSVRWCYSSAPAGERTAPTDPSVVASLSAGAPVQLPPAAGRELSQTGEEEAFEHPIFSIEPLVGHRLGEGLGSW